MLVPKAIFQTDCAARLRGPRRILGYYGIWIPFVEPDSAFFTATEMSLEHDQRPFVLVVDDNADDMRSSLVQRLNDSVAVSVLHPSDVKREDLARTDLVLMGYKLEQWPERDGQSGAAFDIRSGMVLAAVFREVAEEATPDRLTAMALYTGHLSEASGRIRPPHSQHVVASLNNLEWIFEKKKKETDLDPDAQAIELANAVQLLHGDWPTEACASEARACELLNLRAEVGWFGRSWQEVRECQPPIHELAGTEHGVLFLRWFLHKVLPYPCFLWDIHQVATRLRMRVKDLKQIIASHGDLSQDLRKRRYTGILHGFLGHRWWRTAIEDYAWELGRGASGNPNIFRDRLRERAGIDLDLIGISDPVVCLNRDFEPTEIASPQEAVRLRPDYWPSFADAAWMKIDAVGTDPSLRAMVEPIDQYRLQPEE